MNKIKLAKIGLERQGNYTGVCLQGSPEEIENTFELLRQWGATNLDCPDFVNDCNGYFWTTFKAFRNAFAAIIENRIYNQFPNRFKGRKGGTLKIARLIADKRIALMRQSRIVVKANCLPVYSVSPSL